MKDKRGLYYHPFPQNTNVRMYVRSDKDDVAFRLWNREDPNLWQEHEWVPYDAIQQAAAMYTGNKFDPDQVYDIRVARALIKEDG